MENEKPVIPSVNYHVLDGCNMRCRHCFATDMGKMLGSDDACKLVALLAQYGFSKINFAGGEPMLHPEIKRLIMSAKEQGMTTSIVTNGTRVTTEWLDDMAGHLDWFTLSMDSPDPERNVRSGRAVNGRPLGRADYEEICRNTVRAGMRLKINTVVTKFNCREDMSGFVSRVRPERWKIMQALRVDGQNGDGWDLIAASDEEFREYAERNAGGVAGVRVVPEDNRATTGSYAMVSPEGRFFDNTRGRHTYSRPILEVGVRDAIGDVTVDREMFYKRGGQYDW